MAGYDEPPELTDQELVNDLDSLTCHLTGWEIEFTESVVGRVKDGVALTPKQRAKIEEIIEEAEQRVEFVEKLEKDD